MRVLFTKLSFSSLLYAFVALLITHEICVGLIIY